MLDQGVWENDRQKYPAGTPIPWDEAKRLRLIGQDDEDESVGGGVIGAPPPAHAPPGRQTRPVKRADSPHPRPKKDQ